MIKKKNRWLTWSVLILLLAAVLRIHDLGLKSLWFDESIEFWMSRAPWNQIHLAVAMNTHDPPFFSYILKAWSFLGVHEFLLRLISVFFSLFAITGVMILGRYLHGREVGLVSGVLLAISTADIRYAQEVGQYSLMVCLGVWTTIFLLRAVQQKGWSNWFYWGVLSLLSLYTHYGLAILFVATGGAVFVYLLFQKRWSDCAAQTAAGGLVALGILPLILVIIPQQVGRLGASTLPVNWPQMAQTSTQILAFQFVANRGIMAWPWPAVPFSIIWVPLVICLAVALVRSRSIVHAMPLLIISWLAYYLISRTGSYFFSPSRHSLLLLPLLIPALALGIVTLNKFPRRVPLIGTLVLAYVVVLSLAIPNEDQQDLRSATQYWLENNGVAEPTFVFYGANPGFGYQILAQTGKNSDNPADWYSQCYRGVDTPYCKTDSLFYSPWLRGARPDTIREEIFNGLDGKPEKLWVVMSHMGQEDDDDIVDALDEDYILAERREFEGALVMQFSRN